MQNRDLLREAIVEFIGPFALVFAGVGSIILTQGGNIVAIALAHGLAIGLMISAVGHISGGHFNPAVTIGLLLGGRTSPPQAVVYIVAQLLGATAAAGVLTLIYPDLGEIGRNNVGINNGVPALGPGIAFGNALIMEIVLTFFLMFVIYGVAVDGRSGKSIAGLVIGLTITIDILAGGVVSGAVMNPARAFGPAVVQQDFTDQLLWWIGPIIGAALASLLYNYVLLAGGRVQPFSDAERPGIDSAVVAADAAAPPTAPAAPPARRSSRSASSNRGRRR